MMTGNEVVPEDQTLMMGTEMVPETSVIFNQLTWLIAREDYINFSRRETFTSYKTVMRFDVHNMFHIS
jgi:hypothetical protein